MNPALRNTLLVAAAITLFVIAAYAPLPKFISWLHEYPEVGASIGACLILGLNALLPARKKGAKK